MKITDLLRPEGIKIGAVAKDKMDAINQLIDLQVASGNIADKAKYKAFMGVMAEIMYRFFRAGLG